MKKVFAFCAIIFLATTYQFSQNISEDETQIRNVIKSFSSMWTESNGVQIGNENSASNFMCILNQKSYNKIQYMELIGSILKNKQVQKHSHDVYKILIKDNIAYEFGLITMIMKNGVENKNETLNIFIKEEGEWKLLSNVPVEMMKEMF